MGNYIISNGKLESLIAKKKNLAQHFRSLVDKILRVWVDMIIYYCYRHYLNILSLEGDFLFRKSYFLLLSHQGFHAQVPGNIFEDPSPALL